MKKEITDSAAPDPKEPGVPGSRPGRRAGPALGARIGAAVVLIAVLVGLFGPLIAPYAEDEMLPAAAFAPMGAENWLGTDYIGRDILSRILYGARVTLGLALAATMLAFVVGTFFGFTAAAAPPLVDTIISRLYDVVLSIPNIMLALVVIAALGTSMAVLVGVIGLIYSANVFRISRALAMDIKVMDFVEVARARGEGHLWIISREIWPNAVIPLASEFGLRLVFAILAVSGLSFLGLGVQPPTAGWGVMVRENMTGMMYGSPAALAPAFAIAMVTISINLIVDDLSSRYGRDISEALG
ncbi:MAG: ABC transporter permease [Gammaproteobacteria bacterium]|nr:ABC transporter permease [Gammaproteobacteria bacterium]